MSKSAFRRRHAKRGTREQMAKLLSYYVVANWILAANSINMSKDTPYAIG